MLSELRFYAAMIYPSHPPTPRAEAMRQQILRLKGNLINPTTRLPASVGLARLMKSRLPLAWLQEVFGGGPTLVPVPQAGVRQAHALWPTHELCKALVAENVGAAALPLVTRIKAVPKSAYAGPGERPDPITHYDSVRVSHVARPPKRIVLVDDILTRGATFLGCATRLAEEYPKAEIIAFAAAQTVGGADPDVLLNPCRGLITGDDHRVNRVLDQAEWGPLREP